jgi:O-antigen ligase
MNVASIDTGELRLGVRRRGSGRSSTLLSAVLAILLGCLLVEVLWETWVQNLLGERSITPDGREVVDPPIWPKILKSVLYFALLAATTAKITVDRRWMHFRTKADVALVAVGVVFAVVGLIGESGLVLIGQALFVYFRGVIVFYAVRALDPPGRHVRPLLWIGGSVIALNGAMAIIQMVVGYPSYRMLGWVNLSWARIDRAHAFFDHPNHLGHVAALMLLGLVAWFVTRPPVARRWWVLFGVVAVGLGASQSRESLLGLAAGLIVIGVVRRGRTRVVLVALAIVTVTATLPLAVKPSTRLELARRVQGVINAFVTPSGEEPDDSLLCSFAGPDCDEIDGEKVPQREIRVLYAQQGARLWLDSPLVGYGVGQFGGIVAYQHDKQWNLNPKFGPHGFNMHGFQAKQVDSFWLHLLVETGTLGVLAYLAWLILLWRPLWRAARDRRERSGEDGADGEHGGVFLYWALGVFALAMVVAFLSSSLEDSMFPPLLFGVCGLAWVAVARDRADPTPLVATATGNGEHT